MSLSLPWCQSCANTSSVNVEMYEFSCKVLSKKFLKNLDKLTLIDDYCTLTPIGNWVAEYRHYIQLK